MRRSLPATASAVPVRLLVTLLVTLAFSLLPTGWLRWTVDVAAVVRLPITPLSDLGTSLAAWLRPHADPALALAADADQRRLLVENAAEFERLYLDAEQRIRALQEQIRQLQQIPPETLRVARRPVLARITARTPQSSHGPVELRRGSREGVQRGTVAVYGGVHLLGRVSGDVSLVRSVLLPLTNTATNFVRAQVSLSEQPPELRLDGPVVQLQPVGDGTLVGDVDRQAVIAEDDVVRLVDPAWPRTAQQMIIGRIVSITVKDAEPLRNTIVVRPVYQVHEVAEVTLLIEDEPGGGEDGS
ncbi:MAG: MreC domain-containing protein [Planctomycetota bacterium]|jgi:hypothetical protein